jgi:hypothetical protein
MHPNDSFSSPAGLANDVAGVSWTSPLKGMATIAGDLWELSPSLGRSTDWSITLNGVTFTGGTIFSTDPYNSSNPDSFANGFGGAGALSFAVSPGDVVSLDLVRHIPAEPATFMGVDETVTLVTAAAVPEPAAFTLVLVGMGALLFLRYAQRAHGRQGKAGR